MQPAIKRHPQYLLSLNILILQHQDISIVSRNACSKCVAMLSTSGIDIRSSGKEKLENFVVTLRCGCIYGCAVLVSEHISMHSLNVHPVIQ